MQCKEMLYGLFLCRQIYIYAYTINVMCYDTIVLITKNYISCQISELVHSSICEADLVWSCSRDVWLITGGNNDIVTTRTTTTWISVHKL